MLKKQCFVSEKSISVIVFFVSVLLAIEMNRKHYLWSNICRLSVFCT